jgi:hypothetical protein
MNFIVDATGCRKTVLLLVGWLSALPEAAIVFLTAID